MPPRVRGALRCHAHGPRLARGVSSHPGRWPVRARRGATGPPGGASSHDATNRVHVARAGFMIKDVNRPSGNIEAELDAAAESPFQLLAASSLVDERTRVLKHGDTF